jgi:hypothetical protein
MAEKILQCGYMSGDTYAAAALLAVDPSVHILLVRDTKATGEHADKWEKAIEPVYRESGVLARVHVFDISKSSVGIHDLWKSLKEVLGTRKPGPHPADATEMADLKRRLCANYAPKGAWPRSITAVTGLLGEEVKSNPVRSRQTIAKAWKVGKLPTDLKFALYAFMASKFAKTEFAIRDNIVVLWSRQSGKRGGAHLELDSSFRGIRQLAWRFAEVDKRATVLLAGDDGEDGSGSRVPKSLRFANDSAHIVDVTNMWTEQVWKDLFKEANAGFLAQFAFFKYLAGDYRVVHLGMRSGMLESMALLGMETFYLEGKGSKSGERMLGFSRNGITYRRIQITDAPGLTGRIAESLKLRTPEAVQGKIAALAKANIERDGFRYNFVTDRSSEEDTAWAAKGYAKASLVGNRLDDRVFNRAPNQWQELGNRLAGLRGFRSSDLDEIVRLVSAKFR